MHDRAVGGADGDVDGGVAGRPGVDRDAAAGCVPGSRVWVRREVADLDPAVGAQVDRDGGGHVELVEQGEGDVAVAGGEGDGLRGPGPGPGLEARAR